MSYTAPAPGHIGLFCDKCRHFFGRLKNEKGSTCPICKKKELETQEDIMIP
jgi:predicted Zn-ribbon and HTH transcriptional regulator